MEIGETKIRRMAFRAIGQRALVEAKMEEFRGHRLIGNGAAAEKCREEAHDLLDCYFDGQVELAELIRGKATR